MSWGRLQMFSRVALNCFIPKDYVLEHDGLGAEIRKEIVMYAQNCKHRGLAKVSGQDLNPKIACAAGKAHLRRQHKARFHYIHCNSRSQFQRSAGQRNGSRRAAARARAILQRMNGEHEGAPGPRAPGQVDRAKPRHAAASAPSDFFFSRSALPPSPVQMPRQACGQCVVSAPAPAPQTLSRLCLQTAHTKMARCLQSCRSKSLPAPSHQCGHSGQKPLAPPAICRGRPGCLFQ